MKSVIKLSMISILSLSSLTACKTKQETKLSSDNTINMYTEEKKYELVVSFFSVAYGIDTKAKTGLDNLIQQDTTEKNFKISIIKTPWGREGEIDYCFDLHALSENQKSTFIEAAKAILSQSEIVHIKENAPCRKLRE